LRDGPARDRITALNTLVRMPTTQWPNELRHVVAARLQRLVDAVAQELPPGSGPRDATEAQRQDELELLVEASGRLRDPALIPWLIRANAVATSGALANMGAPAVPAILAQLDGQVTFDGHRRLRLLTAYRLLLDALPEDLTRSRQARRIVGQILRETRDPEELAEAIVLADEIDDGEALEFVRAIGIDPALLEERFQDPAQRERLRSRAQDIMNRRISLRD
jgi:hypothetical protein